MDFWLCALVLGFATFAHIETIPPNNEAQSGHHIHTRGLDDIKVPFDPEFKPLKGTIPGIEAGKVVEPELFEPFEVDLEGRYYWERIYYIDNRNNSSPYSETHKYTKTIKTSYSELTKYVYDASLKFSHKVEAGGKFEIISASVETSLSLDLSTSYEKTVESKTDISESKEVTKEFGVGANSFGEMFRLVYKGPGMSYATDTVSTNGSLPLDKVFIHCKVRRIPLIMDIRVVYTDQSIDRPENLITETYGGNPDVNSGAGRYTWLVPIWTANASDAASNIQIVIQNERNDAYDDLAPGDRGALRYLKIIRSDPYTKISRVGLLRSPRSTYIYNDRKKHGWDECTSDINERKYSFGVRYDWLHLCWNTISTAYTF